MSGARRPSAGSPASQPALRREVVATARALIPLRLTHGTSGNVSARSGDGFLITPSGRPYDETAAADVVRISADGVATGRREPSTEWRLHAAVYAARPEAQAIVHAHSPAATALACLRRGIPAFHYVVALAGGPDVRCAPYATFGTPELASAAVGALAGRRACLLANHGQIAIGPTLASALRLASEIESLAEQYLRALAAGEPVLLSDAEMADVLRRFATYGPDAASASKSAGRASRRR